jgi:hypothetical protein
MTGIRKSPSIPLFQRGRFGKVPFTKGEVQKGTFPKGTFPKG